MPVAREIPYVEPLSVFARFAADPFCAFLDCAAPEDQRARYSYLCIDPQITIVADVEDDHGPDPFEQLELALASWQHGALPGLPPFQGGAAGVLGYELGGCLEKLPQPASAEDGFPDMVMAIYDTVIAFDHLTRKAWIISSGYPAATEDARNNRAEQRINEFLARLNSPEAAPTAANGQPPVWTSNNSHNQYLTAVQKVIEHVFAGDLSQANISQEFSAERPKDINPFDIYRAVRSHSPAPFAAYLGCGDGKAVCSASPERFLSLNAQGHVETRPIKGTRPRGCDAQEDLRLADELRASEKDRAENLMIVDLMRNDLSRVCMPGSVATPQLIELETFENVHHLVSVVTGELGDGAGAVDLLRATFPGGSVTGAPKIRAMELIHEVEQRRRGPYCGSAAWIGFDGAMDSSILIRTMTVTENLLKVAAGGGIVSDSDPQAEYEETLIKVDAILSAFDAKEDVICQA